MTRQSNLFTAIVTETEGTGYPDFLYAYGRGTGISTSPSKALAIAKSRANASLSAQWEEQNNPHGGCSVLSETSLYKGGKLIFERF